MSWVKGFREACMKVGLSSLFYQPVMSFSDSSNIVIYIEYRITHIITIIIGLVQLLKTILKEY